MADGSRLSGQADRLGRHPAPGQPTSRVGPAFGHPEWGPFRLGKTNPNFSTSGLSDTDRPDLRRHRQDIGPHRGGHRQPQVDDFAQGRRVGGRALRRHDADVPQQLVPDGSPGHVAPATCQRWPSRRSRSSTTTSGNPDGVLDPGERPRKPRIPLVAIYPKEGTLFSDNPFIILDAPWVDRHRRPRRQRVPDVRAAARRTSSKVLDFGFRPGNPARRRRQPDHASQRRRSRRSRRPCSRCPSPPVLVKLLNKWQTQRKSARVLLVLDVSGSMGDPAIRPTRRATKLDLAKKAAIEALDQFKPDDEVGLRIFTTGLGPNQDQDFLDLVPVGPIGPNREALASTHPGPVAPERHAAVRGHPAVLRRRASRIRPEAHQRGRAAHRRPERGRQPQRRRPPTPDLLTTLRRGSEGENAKPVRIFPIALRHATPTSTRCGPSPRPRTPRCTTPATRPPSTRCSPRS